MVKPDEALWRSVIQINTDCIRAKTDVIMDFIHFGEHVECVLSKSGQSLIASWCLPLFSSRAISNNLLGFQLVNCRSHLMLGWWFVFAIAPNNLNTLQYLRDAGWSFVVEFRLIELSPWRAMIFDSLSGLISILVSDLFTFREPRFVLLISFVYYL